MKNLLASFLTLCLLAACGPTPTPASPEVDIMKLTSDSPVFQGSLVDPSILANMHGASIYWIQFTIDEDMVNIKGHEEVRYTNREDLPLDRIELRLFPNILGGQMIVSNLTVNGSKVSPTYDLQDSLMIVSLPSSLAVGAEAVLRMDFTVQVTTDLDKNYGVQAYADGVLTLAHAYPMIAVYNEEGWNAEIPSQSGDLTFSDASFYLVSVDAPKDVTVVASGVETALATSGQRTVIQAAIGPARDFFLAASRDFEVVSEKLDGVTVNSYAPKSLQSGSASVLKTAIRALETYVAAYAPYPYSEFDLVATPTRALGVEYPGATVISERVYTDDEFGSDTRAYRESTVAHEVGHQWFYNLVGNDQLDEPWLDESLTQFATWEYYRINYGPSSAFDFAFNLHARWNRVAEASIPIGKPVAAYAPEEYGAIVYGRGPLFFDALRSKMGTDSFNAFLKDYVNTYAWKIATTDGLKSLAETHCSCDLTPLFEEWIDP
jgi:hypothetical protein